MRIISLLTLLGILGCAEAREVDPGSVAGPADHAVVLVYHHVSVTTPRSTSITPDRFAEHLAYIADNGFQVWAPSRIVHTLRNGDSLPDNVVGITFDDAYASVFSTAHPLMQARNWPYAVFINTDAIDRGQRPYMNWQELKTLASDGVEMGNHSRRHEHLLGAEARADLDYAQQRIEAETGTAPVLFAYPYGEYTADLAAQVTDLGLIGFGQHSGAIGTQSDFKALPRYPVGGDYTDLPRLATRLQTRPLYIRAQPAAPVIVSGIRARPAVHITLPEGPFDPANLACYASGQGQMRLNSTGQSRQYTIEPRQPLQVGRTKYNCTVPHRDLPGEYFWWSYLLMYPHSDGSWYSG